MGSRPASARGYGDDAEETARRYEAVAFETVHDDFLPWLPTDPGRVVDIGAGSGRDAAALSARGHQVVAVEPTPELRDVAERLHADAAIEWVDDALPALSGLRGRFDLILLSAVWMHLDEQERSEGMRRLAELVSPGGRVAMSLRHGPVPAGRRMFEVSAAETIALADRFGLSPVHHGEKPDVLGRAGVRWSALVFRAEADTDRGEGE
ncbi:class I SAM-dependent methyltransferase [Streptomyces malaysiensis]|nr:MULTISPECIES: class I SAM-dependent methyltransferase [unclassified Streptomyces]MCC4318668.1 class I SAM-dependent methyltransferase [Streptomyces malaysiensis]MCM3811416.1 class I SAM-dependent methyltransferase [Streptomyces sp. DR7-3]